MHPPEDVTRPRGAWRRLLDSLAFRLAALLVVAMAVTFTLLGYVNIFNHRRDLEQATLQSAERASDLIERSTAYCMLRNDREGLDHIIATIAREQGVVGIRIYNQDGRITLSTDSGEQGARADLASQACSGCHSGGSPLPRLDRAHRFRIYASPAGERILGIINPIENRPDCSEAACHAHPPSQKILGVLDTSLSLASADRALATGKTRMLVSTVLALSAIAVITGLFGWGMVHRPVQALKTGTRRLSSGDLGYQIEARVPAELGELARSFNAMSSDLRQAREENAAWTRTLEQRVDDKTKELHRVYEHMVHVEKMASIGKLAATIAHEINNPLSGILTYAKLMRKRLARGGGASASPASDFTEPLQIIESESRRCGDIVKNLLRFSRAAPMNLDWSDLNGVVDRVTRLTSHQMDLGSVQLHLDLARDLPKVRCDPAQIEQALLAVVINAIEAMPHGGNLWISTALHRASGRIRIEVRDDGIGIPADIQASLFEPFFSTKESGHGVGLGLAVSRGIFERHSGTIEVSSSPGSPTVFVLSLPATTRTAELEPAGAKPLEERS